jgi:hypothetical protein
MVTQSFAPVQGLWIGGILSSMERLSIKSFIENGHSYHLYTYGKVKGIPERTTLRNATEILPASMIFKYTQHSSFAGFADYFRYKLLLERGGWWADLDMICLKPLDQSADYVFSSQSKPDGTENVTSGLIRAPASSPLMEFLFTQCLSKEPSKLEWGEVGPMLMAKGVKMFGLEEYVSPASMFCPVPYFQWPKLLAPGYDPNAFEGAYTVHLWNEMWRRRNCDKNGTFPPTCIYEYLKRRYGVDPEIETCG